MVHLNLGPAFLQILHLQKDVHLPSGKTALEIGLQPVLQEQVTPGNPGVQLEIFVIYRLKLADNVAALDCSLAPAEAGHTSQQRNHPNLINGKILN